MAIFLLGMLSLEKGFKSFSGGVLATFLQCTTDATWKSLSFGVIATTIMQSSSLLSVLTISFLSAGLIPLAQGIGIIFGANLGTTITAIIGAISASVSGRQLALAHLFFNWVTGAIAIVFISQFVVAVDWVSNLVGIAADNYTLKFAVFHTLFNLVGVALMIPLINPMVVVLQKLLREKAGPVETTRVRYLNKSALEFPDMALEVIARETVHLAENAFEILAHGLNLQRTDITSSADINAAGILFANLYSTEKDMELDEAESDTAETGMTQAGQNEAMLADDVTE